MGSVSFLPSFPSFLPACLPARLPSFPPSLRPSFLPPSFLPFFLSFLSSLLLFDPWLFFCWSLSVSLDQHWCLSRWNTWRPGVHPFISPHRWFLCEQNPVYKMMQCIINVSWHDNYIDLVASLQPLYPIPWFFAISGSLQHPPNHQSCHQLHRLPAMAKRTAPNGSTSWSSWPFFWRASSLRFRTSARYLGWARYRGTSGRRRMKDVGAPVECGLRRILGVRPRHPRPLRSLWLQPLRGEQVSQNASSWTMLIFQATAFVLVSLLSSA